MNEEVVEHLPTKSKIRDAKANDMLRRNFGEVVKRDGRKTIDENKLRRRKALIGGAVQIGVPDSYKKPILYCEHCLIPAGRPGKRKIYDVIRKTNDWPYVASDLHKPVFRCKSSRRHRPSQKNQR